MNDLSAKRSTHHVEVKSARFLALLPERGQIAQVARRARRAPSCVSLFTPVGDAARSSRCAGPTWTLARLRPEHSERTIARSPDHGLDRGGDRLSLVGALVDTGEGPEICDAVFHRDGTPVLDFRYHYVEYPAIYHKDRLVAQIRAAQPGESKDDTQKRGDREFMELQQSPFFRVWACAGADEILSALHRRLLLGASA